MSEIAYLVPDMSCGHCTVAVTDEVSKVSGVETVEVDLATKLVQVRGIELDGDALVAAIDEAGYEAVAA
jgi:copper chaperone CopZ